MAEPKKLYMGPTSTQELINLLKADLAKKQDIIQFTKLPAPEDAVGRCYEYVGPTTMEYTNGHIYHSDGFTWEEVYKGQDGKTWQIVDSLPSFVDADYDTIYFVYKDGKLVGYVKGNDKMEQITSSSSWELVLSLPSWVGAKNDVLYLLLEGDTLKGCVKNPDIEDEWYELGGGKANFNELDNTPIINGIDLKNEAEPNEPKEVEFTIGLRRYPVSEHYDPDAVYPDEPEQIRVNEFELDAMTDERIRTLWDETEEE